MGDIRPCSGALSIRIAPSPNIPRHLVAILQTSPISNTQPCQLLWDYCFCPRPPTLTSSLFGSAAYRDPRPSTQSAGSGAYARGPKYSLRLFVSPSVPHLSTLLCGPGRLTESSLASHAVGYSKPHIAIARHTRRKAPAPTKDFLPPRNPPGWAGTLDADKYGSSDIII